MKKLQSLPVAKIANKALTVDLMILCTVFHSITLNTVISNHLHSFPIRSSGLVVAIFIHMLRYPSKAIPHTCLVKKRSWFVYKAYIFMISITKLDSKIVKVSED